MKPQLYFSKSWSVLCYLTIFLVLYCDGVSPNFTSEAVVPRCSAKKVILEISGNSQENTSDRLFFNKVMCTTVSEYPQYGEQSK